MKGSSNMKKCFKQIIAWLITFSPFIQLFLKDLYKNKILLLYNY